MRAAASPCRSARRDPASAAAPSDRGSPRPRRPRRRARRARAPAAPARRAAARSRARARRRARRAGRARRGRTTDARRRGRARLMRRQCRRAQSVPRMADFSGFRPISLRIPPCSRGVLPACRSRARRDRDRASGQPMDRLAPAAAPLSSHSLRIGRVALRQRASSARVLGARQVLQIAVVCRPSSTSGGNLMARCRRAAVT